MKFLIFLSILVMPFISKGQGNSCTDPKLVSVTCPAANYLNETTNGFTNSVTSWYYGYYPTQGNDVVYAITIPSGTQYLQVSVNNASKPLYLIYTGSTCNGSNSNPTYISSSLNNKSFYVSGMTKVYIWIDHNNASDITYDISFGMISNLQYVFIPDTRGTLFWDLACNNASLTKPGMDLTYNGSHLTLPIVYSPLGTSGVMDCKLYVKNQSGVEAVKKVKFWKYGSDIKNVTPTGTSLPGFYNSGTWNATVYSDSIVWLFTDAAGKGAGDYTGVAGSCITYTFSLNMTPMSNNSLTTNITVDLFGDGHTPSSYYYNYSGCCAAGSCYGGSSSSGGSAAFGVGFNDPAALPVTISSFTVTEEKEYIEVGWTTGFEKDIVQFEVEKSIDGVNFYLAGTIEPVGKQQIPFYEFKDYSKDAGTYYRLKIVDIDGSTDYSKTVFLKEASSSIVTVFPNPAVNSVSIVCDETILEATVLDSQGRSIILKGQNQVYTISDVPPGVYCLFIKTGNNLYFQKLVKE